MRGGQEVPNPHFPPPFPHFPPLSPTSPPLQPHFPPPVRFFPPLDNFLILFINLSVVEPKLILKIAYRRPICIFRVQRVKTYMYFSLFVLMLNVSDNPSAEGRRMAVEIISRSKLHESMGPGRDRSLSPCICCQTCICIVWAAWPLKTYCHQR